MTEESELPRADVLEQESLNGSHGDGRVEGRNSHTRAEDIRAGVVAATEKTRDAAGKVVGAAKEKVGHNPHVEAAAEKTRGVVDRAVGAAREQAEQHPTVATTVERTVGTSGKAARTAGQQVKRHPRLTSGLAAGGIALLTAVRMVARRRRSKSKA